MAGLQDANPCFAERYRNVSRIDKLFTEVMEDLRVLTANSNAVDFGDGYEGLDDDRREVPEEHRHKLIPMMDWTLDVVSRFGSDPIPVHGTLHEYVEYEDDLFPSLVRYVQHSIDDMELVSAAGFCNLKPQAEKLREALTLAEQETGRKCGAITPRERDSKR